MSDEQVIVGTIKTLALKSTMCLHFRWLHLDLDVDNYLHFEIITDGVKWDFKEIAEKGRGMFSER